MRRAAALLIAVSTLALGCYRTRYINFATPQQPPAASQVDRNKVSRWQHFWLFGWVPEERRLDAASACGGIERVDSIETRQTGVQGLIAAFAGYVINIYSPYTGWVVCDDDPRRRPPK